LLFDTGLSDRLVGPARLYENVDGGYGQIKFKPASRGQLADIGITPADITYLRDLALAFRSRSATPNGTMRGSTWFGAEGGA